MEIYLSGWYETWKSKAIMFTSKYIHIENPKSEIPEAIINFEKNRKGNRNRLWNNRNLLHIPQRNHHLSIAKISEDHLSTGFFNEQILLNHDRIISKQNENRSNPIHHVIDDRTDYSSSFKSGWIKKTKRSSKSCTITKKLHWVPFTMI